MKLAVTVRADNNIKGYTKITLPLIEKFAKKWEADFILLQDESVCKTGDGRFHYRIFEVGRLLDTYDRVLNLDADIIINKNCPNLFEVVDKHEIGSIEEDAGSRKSHRRNMIRKVQEKWGDLNWWKGYINTGVFLVSQRHKDIFQPFKGKIWEGWGSDDVHLGYMIQKYRFPIQQLSYKFNHMTMFSESWNHSPDRFGSFIIHYAGQGVFDPDIKSKNDQIKRDYKKIWQQS